MQQSNRIILTDVDGVMLDWANHFSKWMKQQGFFEIEGAEKIYSMHERYGISIEQKEKLVREFNNSAWMRNQPAMPDCEKWVKLLYAEGWTFIPITSQTLDIPAQELRKSRLKEIFGEKVFVNFIILDTGSHKDEALKGFTNTGLWWIEDKFSNAKQGLECGLKPLLYNHSYNQGFDHPMISRVNNWKHIYEIINEKQ